MGIHWSRLDGTPTFSYLQANSVMETSREIANRLVPRQVTDVELAEHMMTSTR